MKFYSNYNNGITALVREDHSHLFDGNGQASVKAGARIFTFCPAEWLTRPEDRQFYTGSHEDMERLLQGHEVIRGCGGWSGYVPFSNGLHSAEMEKEWVTTLKDVMDAFDLAPSAQ